MRITRTLCLIFMLLLANNSLANAATSVGPYDSGSTDSGTCGNDWANDSYQRSFTDVTVAGATENYDGGFTSVAGHSPNACNGGPDNGHTILAGVSGTFNGTLTLVISGGTQFTPGACTAATCNTTTDFVHTVYGAGASGGIPFFDFNYYVCDGRHWRNSSVGNFDDIIGGPATCKDTLKVTWFDPHDGRVDGQPGDRVVIWCNLLNLKAPDQPNIVVYGVGDQTNQTHGFLLHQFMYTDLIKAGPGGLTVNAGPGNGLISIVVKLDGNTLWIYVAWNGGNFHATGQGIFAKSVKCTAPPSTQ